MSIVVLCSASSSQCCQVFGRATRCLEGSHVESLQLQSKQFFVSVTFESVLWLHHTQNSRTLFQVSCRRCGIHHGPPSTRLFLSTSAHHPGISFRKKISTLRLVCLNERFSHSQHRFTSLTFVREIPLVFDIKTSIHT